MAENKKYFYLKLKDNFFDTDAMIILESMQDGYKYSNILLKLFLRSIKNEGRLMFNDRIPFNSNMLAQVTRHSVGDIDLAVKIFKDLELIEVLENGAIYMLDIQNYIGTSSSEAVRKQVYREKINQERDIVPLMSHKNTDKRPPEIEIKLEREKEIKTRALVVAPKDSIPYHSIINHLNKTMNTSYRAIDKTRALIKARFNEGFNEDDFYHVHVIKLAEWGKDEKMSKFLRPETLYGNKFEGYRNQKISDYEKSQLIQQQTGMSAKEVLDIQLAEAEIEWEARNAS